MQSGGLINRVGFLFYVVLLALAVSGCEQSVVSLTATPVVVAPTPVPPTWTPAPLSPTPDPTPTAASPTPVQPTLTPVPQLVLTSNAFEDQGEMPLAFALRTFDTPEGWPVYCPGENVSPSLSWSNVPPDTESLALTVYDHITLCEACRGLAPEGRIWGHWGIYNISVATTGLDKGLPANPALPDGSIQVVNGYNEVGYGGPCPPLDHVHVYVFTLYALNTELDLPEGASIEDLSAALDGHVLERAELVAMFRGR